MTTHTPSALFYDTARAVERMERADIDMRHGWPVPKADVTKEWNAARRAAEIAVAFLKRELR